MKVKYINEKGHNKTLVSFNNEDEYFDFLEQTTEAKYDYLLTSIMPEDRFLNKKVFESAFLNVLKRQFCTNIEAVNNGSFALKINGHQRIGYLT